MTGPAPYPAGPAEAPADRALAVRAVRDLLLAVAGELRDLGRRIDDASLTLICDSAVARRHAGSLQAFDRLAQGVGECAALIEAATRHGDADRALSLVRLVALRDHLQVRLQARPWEGPAS